MTPDPLAPLLKQLDSEIRYRETHGLRDHDTALFRACRLALQQAELELIGLRADQQFNREVDASRVAQLQQAAQDLDHERGISKHLMDCEEDAHQRAEALTAQVQALRQEIVTRDSMMSDMANKIQALRPYLQHRNGCSPRAACVDDSGTGMEDMSYPVEVPARPCTCGLAALLGATPAQTGEPK